MQPLTAVVGCGTSKPLTEQMKEETDVAWHNFTNSGRIEEVTKDFGPTDLIRADGDAPIQNDEGQRILRTGSFAQDSKMVTHPELRDRIKGGRILRPEHPDSHPSAVRWHDMHGDEALGNRHRRGT